MSVGLSHARTAPRPRGVRRASGADSRPKARVLVCEKLADAGMAALEGRADVDLGLGWSREERLERVGDYEALIVRSATKVDADLIAHAERLRVIGRAGTGVDNVDVAAATERGIVVVNAPDANSIAAAEHTLALMLALARRIPQAHASLVAGRWERQRYKGAELAGKVLGVLGLGRIGTLVAERAQAFGMKVIAYDPYVGSARFEELGVRRADLGGVLRHADFLTLHLPGGPETDGLIDRRALGETKPGVRLVNTARGTLVDEAALADALEAGRVAGAALDVFADEPVTEHSLFGREDVIVTPHLGASTAEAQARAGAEIAEQVLTSLASELPSTAVNLPRLDHKARERIPPILPLAEQLARVAAALCGPPGVDRIEVTLAGRLADLDPELVTRAALRGLLRDRRENDVSYVNAPSLAAERGIRATQSREPDAGEFAELLRVAAVGDGTRAEVAGTRGAGGWPHLVEAWGQLFSIELEPFLTFLRYRDRPGMIGRIGTRFGEHGINISSAAVGRRPETAASDDEEAVMVIATEEPVPEELVGEILGLDGFFDGRTVAI